MANESPRRQQRPPATPQNSAAMGVILVVAAVFIAILLFNAGGGNAADTNDGRTAAESANGGRATTTTTTAPPAVTTPPANLQVVVANGSGVSGRAKATAEKLNVLGYTNTQAVDGTATPTTMVYFAEGLEADGIALVRQINLPDDRAQAMPATQPLNTPVPGAALILLVGADFDPANAVFGSTTVPTN